MDKNRQINFRVTQEEWQRLFDNTRKHGLRSLGGYIIWLDYNMNKPRVSEGCAPFVFSSNQKGGNK